MDTYLTASSIPAEKQNPEQNWLQAARDGEPWALEELYRSYNKQIYGLCYRMLGRADDAEDAMQAAFVQAFREIPRFRGASLARTWLYRIATNESLNILRRRARSADSMYLDDEMMATAPDGVGAIQRRLAVRSSLSRVKTDLRVILILRYWEDLSYDEIATVLGVSMPCVKMRLSRARAEFRKQYGEEP